MPWKQWAYMERVTSPDFQSFLQNQAVAQFTNAAQRDSLWTPVPPPKGALCITQDTMTLWTFNGTAWAALNVGGGVSLPVGTMRVVDEMISQGVTGAIGATELAIPGYLVNVTPVAGRTYYVKFGGLVQFTNNAVATFRVRIGSVTGGRVALLPFGNANGAGSMWAEATTPVGLTVGAAQALQLCASVSVGTFTISGDPLNRALFQVLERGA